MPIFPTPAWAREITVDTAGARCASHRKGQAPSEDWLRQYFYPHITKVFSSPPYARHRSFSPKPPSERSQNPKTWGNWEGIGVICRANRPKGACPLQWRRHCRFHAPKKNSRTGKKFPTFFFTLFKIFFLLDFS